MILCHSDASLANLALTRSTGACVIFLVHDDICCPILWKSKAIKRVVHSTLAAEACALVDALDCSYFISNAMSDIMYSYRHSVTPFPIVAYTDNDGLHKNVYSTTMADEFRIRIDLAAIKEMIDNK